MPKSVDGEPEPEPARNVRAAQTTNDNEKPKGTIAAKFVAVWKREPQEILRLPAEYRRWRLWEVIAPLGIPVCVFLWLFVVFFFFGHDLGVPGSPKTASDALTAITGAGDFLIFGALLTLNVYSFIDFRVGELDRSSVPEGEDFGKSKTLLVAIFLLFSYGLVRVSVHTTKHFVEQEAQFWIAVGSTMLLLLVLLWINKRVSELHIAIIKNEVRARHLKVQYNQF
jgi:hypothetical protein